MSNAIMPNRPLGVALIGTGFMGKTHVFGFASAPCASSAQR